MTEKDVQIKSRELNLWYGNAQALNSVSMDMPENKVTAVIGPSRRCKSTFLRCINRMNDLIKDCRITGKLLFGGRNIYGRDADVVAIRKNIGMVFKRPNPFPMSIYDNIAYAPRVHGIRGKHKPDEVVETSLSAAALWDEVSDKLDIAARSEWRTARVSDHTEFFLLGGMIELGNAKQIFENPEKKSAEDHITGRFA